ncbi:MAG: hypothetical protein H6R01_895 [Burkholderiaceae bacterium]|nr:hypothetical protein [Burkholderiaceae bacterium]
MKKQWLCAFLLAVAAVPTALADIAIATDRGGQFYQASRATIGRAKEGVLEYCSSRSTTGGCKIVFTSSHKSAGYGAVATSSSGATGYSAGYGSQYDANRRALHECEARGGKCKIAMKFRDTVNQ